MTAHHYLEKIIADLEQSSFAQRRAADEFEQRAMEFRKKADDDALDADEMRALLDYVQLPECEVVNRTLAENVSEKSDHKNQHSSDTEDCADDRETVRVSGDSANHAPHAVKMQRLLYLTVPHLTHAVQDHAHPYQKGVLIAHCERRDSERNAGNQKRYSPLTVIANFLGVHRRAPVSEIRIRMHLNDDGELTQEVILPRGWRFAPYQPS